MLKFNLRLTRNKLNKSPLNLVKKFAGREVDLKGKPNYSRKLWEWFEMQLEENPNFVDSAEELTETQVFIQKGDLDGLKEFLADFGED